jgi:hypothetical protein
MTGGPASSTGAFAAPATGVALIVASRRLWAARWRSVDTDAFIAHDVANEQSFADGAPNEWVSAEAASN